MKYWVIAGVVFVLVTGAVISGYVSRFQNILQVDDQVIDDTVLIRRVAPLTGGYIIVTMSTANGTVPVAISDYLYPEPYDNIRIPLNAGTLDSDPKNNSGTFRAELFEDIGDQHTFEGMKQEQPAKLLGNFIRKTFRVQYSATEE